jgi:hypothetical protein
MLEMRPRPFKSHVIVTNKRQRKLTFPPCHFLSIKLVLIYGYRWTSAEVIKLKLNHQSLYTLIELLSPYVNRY